MTAIPYHLRPKDTHLPAGHDDTLDPAAPPTDPATRGVPASTWPARNLSRGGTAPPDAPLAGPATDPAVRGLPPFSWPRGPSSLIANRPLRETVGPDPFLDPDIAMWPEVIVSIWPFTGAPTTGVWPKGWLGIDNTGTPYVCTVGGSPGTWSPLSVGVIPGSVPLGVLGYAQTTTGTPNIGTTPVAISGLSVAVTVGTSRMVSVTVNVANIVATGGGLATDQYTILIQQDGLTVGQDNVLSGSGATAQWTGSPSAGSHTYSVECVRATGSDLGDWAANANAPTSILVEDIGT